MRSSLPVGRGAVKVTVASLGCLLLLSRVLPALAKAEVSYADTAAFWDEILNEQYKGQEVEELPQLMKVTLNKYARDNKLRRYAKAGAIGTGAAGAVLGGLAPLLREWGARKQQDIDELQRQEEAHDRKVAESEASAGTKVAQWHRDAPSTRLGRVRDYVAGPKANWGNRLWKASGALGALLMLTAIGLYVAKHTANQKIQDDRRKYRKILADQRKQMAHPEDWAPGEDPTPRLLDRSVAPGEAGQSPAPEEAGQDSATRKFVRSAGQDQARVGWRRPEYPATSSVESALKAAQDVMQVVQEGGEATQGAAAKPETPAGGVFIGANDAADAEKELSNDDVKRLIELAKELGKPAVFYP